MRSDFSLKVVFFTIHLSVSCTVFVKKQNRRMYLHNKKAQKVRSDFSLKIQTYMTYVRSVQIIQQLLFLFVDFEE